MPSAAMFRKSHLYRPLAAAPAFTIAELLVAGAVLALLMVMVAQIVQSGGLAIAGSRKYLAADAQARDVFSRLQVDLSRMPRRADVDALFSARNNALFFFSEGPGFYASANAADRNALSLIGYRVNTNAQLERLGKGLAWTNSLALTYPAPLATNATPAPASTLQGAWGTTIGTPPDFTNGTDADYHVLADGVFRLFYCFQQSDGRYVLTLGNNPVLGKFQDATAIIITLAVLDGESRKVVADTSKLAAALPDPSLADLNNRVLPAQLWQAAVNDAATFAAAAEIPRSAAARVRIYQRSFPLPTR
ncbi:hypothetical protein DB346_07270 [Verrucomicrobia bacterium LW23]|nr:hypothetical protein DB346_07270 [Verrucomicrobia bacterium LW23]